jgi:predicted O-methyltransferase YrrM
MLERVNDPRYAVISQPSKDALALLRIVLERTPAPCVCEIGVGIGATTVELCRLLNGRGELWLFDFDDTLTELARELESLGFRNLRLFGNQRKTFDSYAWTLAMVHRQSSDREASLIDFAYLDGAHAFHCDGPAAILLKSLLRPNGILLFDDYDWTFGTSMTQNPKINPQILDEYTEEQIDIAHVKLVCDLFFDRDPAFQKLNIGCGVREKRRAYIKVSR